MEDIVYRYHPGRLVKAFALLATPLGLLQLADYVSDLLHQHHPSFTVGMSGLCMLFGGLMGFYGWRNLEVRLSAATRKGESSCQPLWSDAPRREQFSFDDLKDIQVLGNLNFCSIYLNRVDGRYYPIGDSYPRTAEGKVLLQERLEELKSLLEKPVCVDPTVSKWFQVY